MLCINYLNQIVNMLYHIVILYCKYKLYKKTQLTIDNLRLHRVLISKQHG